MATLDPKPANVVFLTVRGFSGAVANYTPPTYSAIVGVGTIGSATIAA